MRIRNRNCLILIGALIATALPSLAAPITMVSCNATAMISGVVFSQTAATSCSGTADSPAIPGTPAYTVSSIISGDLLHGSGQTLAVGGIFASPGDTVRSTASGVMSDDEMILFSGLGLATLRLDVAISQSTPGNGGTVAFVLDGAPRVLSALSVFPQSAILDFTIPLGVLFDFAAEMRFQANSSAGDGGHSGVRFDVTRLRLYGADGTQVGGTGAGQSGRQFIAFRDPNDLSIGPVLANIPRVPESSTFGLFLLSGCFAMAARKVRGNAGRSCRNASR